MFACAVAWPGLSRGGKTDDDAMVNLLESAPRYAAAVKRARAGFVGPKAIDDFKVVARVKGDASTEFGIPGQPAPGDDQVLTSSELSRWQALLRAAWAAWDEAAKAADGITLTVGPRGGGRPLAKMAHHVFEAEQAYIRQLGSKHPPGDEIAILRAASLEALQARAKGETPPNPNQVRNLWSPRYYIRRSAWHSLDHAWELLTRSGASRPR